MYIKVVKDLIKILLQIIEQLKMDNKFKTTQFILIDKQLQRVKRGLDSDKLGSLIAEYEFSPSRTHHIDKKYLDYYFAALLLSNKFIELKFAVKRNSQFYQGVDAKYFYDVAQSAINQNFTEMFQKINVLVEKTENQLKDQFVQAGKKYLLKILSRDYINFNADELKRNYGISRQDLQKFDYKLDGNFVLLPQNAKLSNINMLMQTRIKQLSTVTENVIKNVKSS